MPEQKHYGNTILDTAYVYTTDYEFKIKYEKNNPNIIKKYGGERKKEYENLKLISFYKNRVDFGDIEADFYSPTGFRKEIINDIFVKRLGKGEDLFAKLNINLNHEMRIIQNKKLKSTEIDQNEISFKFSYFSFFLRHGLFFSYLILNS